MNRQLVFGFALLVVVLAAGVFIWNGFFGQPSVEQSETVTALESVPAPTIDSIDPGDTSADETTLEADGVATEDVVEDPADDFPAIVDNALRDLNDREFPIEVGYEIIETFEHDTSAFTQGFELSEGRLFESTGLAGLSSIRELDPETGEVLRSSPVPQVFAEGLTVIEEPAGSTAIQLTWKDGVAFRYDLETFDVVDSYDSDGEGWGLCHDGDQLVMSDGSDRLTFRDSESFAPTGDVAVTLSDVPVLAINELECVGQAVWANIWQSPLIIQIDPSTGTVTRVLNAVGLIPTGLAGNSSSVLNGIAYDAEDGTYLLTGKNWPVTYRVRLFDDPAAE